MKQLKIIADAEKLAEGIRNYSKAQKKLWQRVPLLALEADGRDGFLDNYSRAYDTGFWALEAGIRDGCYSVYVDLATGELVDAYSASGGFSVCDIDVPKESKIKPAGKEDVLTLAFRLDELDARKLVNSLERKAKEPYPSYYNPEEQEAWRDKKRKELNLQELFVR